MQVLQCSILRMGKPHLHIARKGLNGFGLLRQGIPMPSRVAAIVVAAGRGARAGGPIPKQYWNLAGEPVLRATLRALATHPLVNLVQPVINPADEPLYA